MLYTTCFTRIARISGTPRTPETVVAVQTARQAFAQATRRECRSPKWLLSRWTLGAVVLAVPWLAEQRPATERRLYRLANTLAYVNANDLTRSKFKA